MRQFQGSPASANTHRNALIRPGKISAGKRFHCVYNGIEAPVRMRGLSVRAGVRRRLGIPEGNWRTGDTSCLIDPGKKGVADCLKAIPLVFGRRPNTQFAIGRDGRGEDAFRRQAQELGVAQSVQFHRARPRIHYAGCICGFRYRLPALAAGRRRSGWC